MLAVISPAKTLDFETATPAQDTTSLLFPDQATRLVDTMRQYSPDDLQALMGISDRLAKLNAERFSNWQWPFEEAAARAAIFAFKGDVYAGLDAYDLDDQARTYLQDHLRILSGLYGLLRPMDAILPYRLEMGKKVATDSGRDLYEFWGSRLAEQIDRELAESSQPVLINLASNEYFAVLKPHVKHLRVITPVFKDWKNGKYKIISFYAKKARGMMVRYMAKNQLERPEDLKKFDFGGYTYDDAASTEDQWVFLRDDSAQL